MSVPQYEHYNHHFVFYMNGRPLTSDVAELQGQPIPAEHIFSEANGGEHRGSFHGPNFLLPFLSPSLDHKYCVPTHRVVGLLFSFQDTRRGTDSSSPAPMSSRRIA